MRSASWKEELEHKRIIMWGASIGGSQAYECLIRNGLEVEAYCDNDAGKHGTFYKGRKVISPETLKSLGGGYVIIIASYAFEVIYGQILQMKLDCEVYIYLLYDPCRIKNHESFAEDEKRKIRALYSTEDYTDRLLGLILDKGFLNEDGFGNIKEYAGFGGIEAYYYDSTAERILESKLTLIDAGSYIGDSILQIQKAFKHKICRTYGFEPNHENYMQIIDRKIPGLTMYNMGLGSRDGKILFKEKGPFFRAAEEEGSGIPAGITRLDSRKEIEPAGTCIFKIDIEGSEMDCLQGAAEFIARRKPYMAVCVYHREKDLFRIPSYLRSLVPEYSFLLRGGMHTVCYAFPERGI